MVATRSQDLGEEPTVGLIVLDDQRVQCAGFRVGRVAGEVDAQGGCGSKAAIAAVNLNHSGVD